MISCDLYRCSGYGRRLLASSPPPVHLPPFPFGNGIIISTTVHAPPPLRLAPGPAPGPALGPQIAPENGLTSWEKIVIGVVSAIVAILAGMSRNQILICTI